jgi:hypothetical protein
LSSTGAGYLFISDLIFVEVCIEAMILKPIFFEVATSLSDFRQKRGRA